MDRSVPNTSSSVQVPFRSLQWEHEPISTMEDVSLSEVQSEDVQEDPAPASDVPRKGTTCHFEPNFHFVPVHVGRGFKEPVRRHSMRETLRKKRWDAAVRTAREATEAKRNFDKFVTRSKGEYCKNNVRARSASSSIEDNRRLIGRQQKRTQAKIEATETNGETCLEARRNVHQHERKERFRVTSLLGGGRRDPFNSLPCAPGLEEYFDEFLGLDNRVFCVPSGSTLQPVRDFSFNLARDSPVTLAAISAYGAAWNRNSGRHLFALKAKAIQLVNQELVNVNDRLTLAVAVLWILESRFGSIQARQIHALGLQHMILIRGGFAALDFGLQMQLSWCIVTLPEPLKLSTELDSNYTRTYFNTFLLFTECVHSIVSSKWSPYTTDINVFTSHSTFRSLLSGAVESRGNFKSHPRLYGLCRLTSLLYIHVVFVENLHRPENLRRKLRKVLDNLTETEKPENWTIEMLTILIFKEGKKNAFEDLERTLLVLQMITIIKRLSSKTIAKLLNLFFGYLEGKRFSGRDRAELWNVDQMNEELVSPADWTSGTWYFASV